jgi:hypothetical protein
VKNFRAKHRQQRTHVKAPTPVRRYTDYAADSLESAQALADLAQAKAKELGLKVTITIIKTKSPEVGNG